jgi:hypothetical protein
MAEQGFYMNED